MGENDKSSYQTVNRDQSWGYCTRDCHTKDVLAKKMIQIVTIEILPHDDCKRLLEFVKLNTTVNTKLQICAGNKLPETKEIYVWEYTGVDERDLIYKKVGKKRINIFPKNVPG